MEHLTHTHMFLLVVSVSVVQVCMLVAIWIRVRRLSDCVTDVVRRVRTIEAA